MMFGRKIGDRIGVSEVEWGRFVDREITPRFPAGLTVYNAAGQWQDTTTKKVVHEPSKMVVIVLPGDDDEIARLNAVVEAYKTRFKQQSVVVIVRPACVSF
jgi:alpha/beta superfamily hydrolase